MDKTESPMLSQWRLDPWKAANQRLQLADSIMPEAHLPRWREAVQQAGPVDLQLSFSWDQQRRIRVQGEINTRASLQCQRCMGDMPVDLQAQVNAAVVFTEQAASQLPADIDPWLAQGDWLDLPRLVEDELLLALPMMPVHEQDTCPGKSHYSAGDLIEESAGKRAFAELADLMKKTNN